MIYLIVEPDFVLIRFLLVVVVLYVVMNFNFYVCVLSNSMNVENIILIYIILIL